MNLQVKKKQKEHFYVKTISLWNLREFFLHFQSALFWQKFCESNIFNKKVTKKLIWRKIVGIMIADTYVFHGNPEAFLKSTQHNSVKITKITLTQFWQKIRESNVFLKKLLNRVASFAKFREMQ